jgi:hypothetical protein
MGLYLYLRSAIGEGWEEGVFLDTSHELMNSTEAEFRSQAPSFC